MNASLNNFLCGNCHCSKSMFSQHIFHCSGSFGESEVFLRRFYDSIVFFFSRWCRSSLRKCPSPRRTASTADNSFTVNTTPCNVGVIRKLNLLCEEFFVGFYFIFCSRKNGADEKEELRLESEIFPNHTKKSLLLAASVRSFFIAAFLAHTHPNEMLYARQTTFDGKSVIGESERASLVGKALFVENREFHIGCRLSSFMLPLSSPQQCSRSTNQF